MNQFDKVKRYFDTGLWSESRVCKAADKGWITAEECNTILQPVEVRLEDLHPELPTPVESEDEDEEFE